MAVYLITLHAYRSWGPDKSKGYVRKHQGILPPDETMARIYDSNASHEPVEFSIVLSLFLGRGTGKTGGHWFTHEGSRKHVQNRAHFDYLIDTYLPDHRGLFWKQGQPLPQIPDGIL